MILDRHWWRTDDGSELVPHGDPRARFLAYTKGQDVPDELAKRVGLTAAMERAGIGDQPKAAAKPRNKAMAKPADKSAEATE